MPHDARGSERGALRIGFENTERGSERGSERGALIILRGALRILREALMEAPPTLRPSDPPTFRSAHSRTSAPSRTPVTTVALTR
eukprot:809297-Prymnesium_polylepis.1